MRVLGVRPECPLCWRLKEQLWSIQKALKIDKRFTITPMPLKDNTSLFVFEYKRKDYRTPTIIYDDIMIKGYRRDLKDLILEIARLKGDLIDDSE